MAALPTLWHIPDELWIKIQPLLPPEKPAGTVGCPQIPFRRVLDGILYVLRTGCQWNAVPRQFASGSTVHARFQQWVKRGVFAQIWQVLLGDYDAVRGIQWRWQALDGALTKAPLGGAQTGPNPTDRGKSGTKRHLLTDRRGAPVSVAVSGAHRHDMKAAPALLDAVAVVRPEPRPYRPQHLCADKGYDYPETEAAMRERGYRPHIRRRGETPPCDARRHKPKRWVVERSHSWLNRFRRLLIRWEKKAENYLALLHFACALIVYRLISG